MDLVPGNVLNQSVATLVAADTANLGKAALKKVHLAQAAFTPSPTLDPTTLTEATFVTYAALDVPTGAQIAGSDPLTGQPLILLDETTQPWRWQTTATTNLPQTIFGVYVTDLAGTVLFGSALLPAPVTLTAIGQILDLGTLRFALPLLPLGPG